MQQQTQPKYDGFESWPHWWKASVITIPPPPHLNSDSSLWIWQSIVTFSEQFISLTSVLGGEMQNCISPIFAFSTWDIPPAKWLIFCSRTRPSTSSVSSTVPLKPTTQKHQMGMLSIWCTVQLTGNEWKNHLEASIVSSSKDGMD